MAESPAVVLPSLDSQAAREHLSDAVSKPQRLAPMPKVCAQLVEMTSLQETDAVRLVRLIESDAAVAGEIMRVANSPALRPRTPVVSLRQAVSWLGIAEVRRIAIAGALRGEVFHAPGHQPESEELWREAWIGSLWAKEIARHRHRHVETAFLAGLMHRAGAALALKLLADFEFRRRTVMDAHTFRDLAAEFEPACGRLLMNDWRLSGDVQDAASEWRHFRTSRQSDLAGMVNAAHLLAEHTLHPQLLGEQEVLENDVFASLGVHPGERMAMLSKRGRVREIAGL